MKTIILITLFLAPLSNAVEFNALIGKEHNKYDVKAPDFPIGITVMERVRLPNGGYTIWSDGFMEQWGRKEKNEDKVIFHKPFTQKSTVNFIIQEYNFGDQHSRHPKNLPEINGVYDFNRSDLVGTWMASGY